MNSRYVYEVVPKIVKTTNEELKKRYADTNSKKTIAQQVLDGITQEINECQIINLDLHMQIQ